MNTAEEILNSASLVHLITALVEFPAPVPAELNIQVTGVKMDSRLLQKGDLFLACFGQHHDARDYIDQAVENGVAAVLAESGGTWQGISVHKGVAVIAVDNLSAKISEIASRFYNDPSASLKVFGITGTNGKTSCSQFIAQALVASGNNCGVIGTLGYGPYNDLKETTHTTPDAVFSQMALAQMCKEEMDSVVMEVSSIGLHQNRVRAVKFDTAIFTNLTRDHLDYHENMGSYVENKRKLFETEGLRSAVINLDDRYALTMLDGIPRNVEIHTYSIKNPAATVYSRNLVLDRHGFSAEICTPYGNGTVKCQLFGFFNISNVLATITTLISFFARYGTVDIDRIFKYISCLKPVNGRMEIVGHTEEVTAIVDYAHTPDGLKCALTAVKDHFQGNIWCVFGCGGNRDRGKRPLMGEIANIYASHLIIADDNPRNESGEEIIRHILSGIEDSSKVEVIRDRAQAIDLAITSASPGDVVLVAGKGHETYQDIGGNRTIFSDANQVRLALQKRLEKS
ncbi:MAG: UDP-N-acetylmuramoyl-L-alanyl-D-glutamate--2,6-diaminopimelate ligase [Gammaproteobacteria bacterium]|nr:UDP-N-acetylmuramoyl-L-alanyl-D-glutamate--2,6-diaminopimelate ligase [Gammaproteobacteria bacterium]